MLRLYLLAFGKGVLLYIVLWAISRVVGKKLIAQLTLLDFVLAVSIGSLTAQAISPTQPTGPLILGMATIAAISLLGSYGDLRGLTLQTLLDSEPVVLVENGKILEENLRRNRLTVRHLESMLRLKGWFSLADIEFVLLEPNGEISILPRSQHRNLTPRDMGISTRYEGLSTQVLHEGQPLPERLRGAGLTEDWLRAELARQGITDPGEAFAAWLESDGSLTVDRYSDQPQ
ncbi:MAG: DUF421 domain-containing protein [Bacillota bacterium]